MRFWGRNNIQESTNIALAHKTMEEFHNIVSDFIFKETGKGLAQLPETSRTGVIVYEIQAAIAAAEKHNINNKYHSDFAAAVLIRGKMPKQMAFGMVDAALNSAQISNDIKEIVDGEEAYNQLRLGTDNLENHIKETLNKLQQFK